jgi:hypothetical protein
MGRPGPWARPRGGVYKWYLATCPKILRKTIGKTKEMHSGTSFASEVRQIQENHLYPGPSQSRGGKSPLPRPMEVRVEVEITPTQVQVRVEVENHLYPGPWKSE